MKKGLLSLLSFAIETSNAIALGEGDSPAVVELRFNWQRNDDVLEIHRAASRRDSILSEGILNEVCRFDLPLIPEVNVTGCHDSYTPSMSLLASQSGRSPWY
jgi:hypothetical protein